MYNGNISYLLKQYPGAVGFTDSIYAQTFRYDQLHRINTDSTYLFPIPPDSGQILLSTAAPMLTMPMEISPGSPDLPQALHQPWIASTTITAQASGPTC
ncbi:MAG: hypothetical protein IPM86_01835 [Saprospiraceae bacterium]|nr:hypothetical protein [Saprospiraceae bacterium]